MEYYTSNQSNQSNQINGTDYSSLVNMLTQPISPQTRAMILDRLIVMNQQYLFNDNPKSNNLRNDNPNKQHNDPYLNVDEIIDDLTFKNIIRQKKTKKRERESINIVINLYNFIYHNIYCNI
jgi:hypothetical protein